MSAETKEQQKYLATWLNTLSVGSFVTGVFTPVAALLNGTSTINLTDAVLSGIGIWVVVGVILHILALAALIDLEE